MKSFKIYLRDRGTHTQLIWLGSLMLIIGIIVVAIGLFNYFLLPQEPFEEFAFSPHALILKELYVAAGIIVTGVVLLLAGAFSAHNNNDKK
jgi:nitrate reductase gamma subunit